MTSAATTPTLSPVVRAETKAVRLLRDGFSPHQVAEATGVTSARVEQLARDFAHARPARSPSGGPGVAQLQLSQLERHPDNPRSRSRLLGLELLAASIRQHGVLAPILVTPSGKGRYRILAGHRRAAAAALAGLDAAPAVIRTAVQDPIALMLVENLQREDLDPIDEARAYRALQEMGHSLQAIADRVGRSAGHVSNRLLVLNCPPDVQRMVAAGEMDVGQAVQLGRSLRRTPHATVSTRRELPPAHFGPRHPLSAEAGTRCRAAGHAQRGHLGGVACGACWEHVVREDERAGGRDLRP